MSRYYIYDSHTDSIAEFSLREKISNKLSRKQQPVEEKPSELKRWGNAAAKGAVIGGIGYGGLTGLALTKPSIRQQAQNLTGGVFGKYMVPAVIAGGVQVGAKKGIKYGLAGYGAYRGGKMLVNKIRGKKENK